MPADPTPSSTPLFGSFIEYDPENGTEGDIERAHRIDHPDGRVAFLVEYADGDDGWELRVESSDGQGFRGTLSMLGWGTRHAVEMTLWQAPNDEAEWLLLGTWTDDDGSTIPWSINLYEEADGDVDVDLEDD